MGFSAPPIVMTPGSIPFAGADGYLAEDNGYFRYDTPPANYSRLLVRGIDTPGNLTMQNILFDPAYFISLNGVLKVQSGNGLISFGTGIGLGIVVTSTTPFLMTSVYNVALIDSTVGAFIVDLPAAASYPGITYWIKKIDASINAVTITPNGTETIDGAATYVLTAKNKYVVILCDGGSWQIVGNN